MDLSRCLLYQLLSTRGASGTANDLPHHRGVSRRIGGLLLVWRLGVFDVGGWVGIVVGFLWSGVPVFFFFIWGGDGGRNRVSYQKIDKVKTHLTTH